MRLENLMVWNNRGDVSAETLQKDEGPCGVGRSDCRSGCFPLRGVRD